MIYVITQGDANNFKAKIGISNDPDQRIKTLQTGTPKDLSLAFKFPVPDDKELEGYLHKGFEERRVNGEWFDFTDVKRDPFDELHDWYEFLLVDDCPLPLKTCECSVCQASPAKTHFPRHVEFGAPAEHGCSTSYRYHYECPSCFFRTPMSHSRRTSHRIWNDIQLTLSEND
jgi:hypothetical protein